MKKIVIIATLFTALAFSNEAKELFSNKCATCHKVDVKDNNSLIAPPINKVMVHIKKSFPNKDEAVAFIKSYVLNPDPTKTICPSIDIFGVMPSQKGAVTDKELEEISSYLYENFPQKGAMNHNSQNKGMHQGQGRGGFMRIDINKDGFISKDEFNTFRANKEGIDISKIKYSYFFNKIDKNSDGKLSKNEFREFRQMLRGK